MSAEWEAKRDAAADDYVQREVHNLDGDRQLEQRALVKSGFKVGADWARAECEIAQLHEINKITNRAADQMGQLREQLRIAREALETVGQAIGWGQFVRKTLEKIKCSK